MSEHSITDHAGSGPGESGTSGPDGLRVSDADRAQVADRLLAAHGEGRLTLAEFDERVGRAHAATVRGDLSGLTADLPAPGPTAGAVRRRGGPASRLRVAGGPPGPCGGDLRAAVAAWAAVSAVNLVVWAVVAVATDGGVAPWWIWVAGPWGLVLALRALSARAAVAAGR